MIAHKDDAHRLKSNEITQAFLKLAKESRYYNTPVSTVGLFSMILSENPEVFIEILQRKEVGEVRPT